MPSFKFIKKEKDVFGLGIRNNCDVVKVYERKKKKKVLQVLQYKHIFSVLEPQTHFLKYDLPDENLPSAPLSTRQGR